MLRDEERIRKLIKKVFEDEFKKQEQNLAQIISDNLGITMQEIKSLKNEVNEIVGISLRTTWKKEQIM